MKRERLRTFLISAVLSAMISASSVGCMITAFQLCVANLDALLIIWAAAALTGSMLCLGRRGLTAICLLALGTGYLWYEGEALEQLAAAVYQCSLQYNSFYHCGILLFSERIASIIYIDRIAGYYGVLTALAVARCAGGRKTPVYAAILGLLPIGLCVALPGALPDLRALFALLTGIALLMLTAGVRRESAAQGNRLFLSAAIPVTAALALLFIAVPPEKYTDHSAAIRSAATSWMQKLPGQKGTSTKDAPTNRVNLSLLDGRDRGRLPVMQVTAQRGGALYLRGRDYDLYTGTGWDSTGGRSEEFGGWGEESGQVTVITYGLHSQLFVPYFPDPGTSLTDGRVPNAGNRTVYTFRRYERGSAESPEMLSAFLHLPEETQHWTKTLLPGESPEEICNFVRNSAEYNLKTGKMPPGERDFAKWFLTASDTGYCVHFATASVVLLRAAGVPARYVTGYRVQTVPGEPVEVTSREAHAWAEYYDGAEGCWRILESTPPALEPVPTIPETMPAETPVPDTEQEWTEPLPDQVLPVPTRRTVENGGLLCTAAAAGVCLLLILRRWGILAARWMRGNQASSGRRTLLYWQEAVRLAKHLGEEPPECLRALAEKALFSNKMLEPEEPELLHAYCRDCRRRLAEASRPMRLLHCYIYVLY